jgi:hypothetical protein
MRVLSAVCVRIYLHFCQSLFDERGRGIAGLLNRYVVESMVDESGVVGWSAANAN